MLHVALVAAAVHWLNRDEEHAVELVDIEMAPEPPKAEALPAEVARQIEQAKEDHAAEEATAAAEGKGADDHGEGLATDAGVDAPPDAPPPPDAKIDAPPPDAALVAKHEDAGTDAAQLALADAHRDAAADQIAMADAGEQLAAGSGSDGSAAGSNGSGEGSNSAIAANGSGSNVATGSGAGSNAIGSNGGSNAIASTDSIAFGSGAGSMLGSGSAGSGAPAAIANGSGSGIAGMDNQPAVDGAPTSAGTAANLLAYFPAGHTISVLVRFDRLRGTEWQQAAEELFRPMPDYQSLFGSRNAGIADKLDMLVISTPRPRDAAATTLVMQTHLPRSSIRDLLSNTGAPVAWSATRAGALGKRSGKLFPNDKRVVLSPWQGWYVLAQPEDLGTLAASSGSVDSIEAKAKLPAWLAGIRTIAKESGDDKKGPALVLTVGDPPATTGPAKTGRYKLPEVGLGVTSLPVPSRISLAMELVKQGWLVRGNIVFATEAEATELETTLNDLKTRITDSHILSAVLKRQHALNIVTGLSLARSGARISYATSVSVSDARALLAAAAQVLASYFNSAQTP